MHNHTTTVCGSRPSIVSVTVDEDYDTTMMDEKHTTYVFKDSNGDAQVTLECMMDTNYWHKSKGLWSDHVVVTNGIACTQCLMETPVPVDMHVRDVWVETVVDTAVRTPADIRRALESMGIDRPSCTRHPYTFDSSFDWKWITEHTDQVLWLHATRAYIETCNDSIELWAVVLYRDEMCDDPTADERDETGIVCATTAYDGNIYREVVF